MRRIGLAFLLLCASLAAVPTAAARERAPATVEVAACQPGGAADTREGAFQARMRKVPRTRTMQVRFYLLERLGDAGFKRVDAPGLGTWRTSRAGVGRFVYTQRVAGLKTRAAYRVVVHHRWLGAGGERLRFARRRSAVCEVEGALPNLKVLRISVRDGLYSVIVRNTGAAPAADVPVTLSIDGVALPPIAVGALAALQTRAIRFGGPRCDTGLSAAIDPADAVRESSESDNVRAQRCRRR